MSEEVYKGSWLIRYMRLTEGDIIPAVHVGDLLYPPRILLASNVMGLVPEIAKLLNERVSDHPEYSRCDIWTTMGSVEAVKDVFGHKVANILSGDTPMSPGHVHFGEDHLPGLFDAAYHLASEMPADGRVMQLSIFQMCSLGPQGSALVVLPVMEDGAGMFFSDQQAIAFLSRFAGRTTVLMKNDETFKYAHPLIEVGMGHLLSVSGGAIVSTPHEAIVHIMNNL